MKKWSFCGRAGVLAALTLTAFVAANVASADPGVGVASSVAAAAAPVTQAVPAPPAAPALPVPAVPVPALPAAPAPVVAVPAIPAVPHVAVTGKAKASVTVSKQHKVAVKSVVVVHAKAGKTQAKASAGSKARVSKNKVTVSRVVAATTTGPCAGFPAPPYNCTQMTFSGDAINSCDLADVWLTGQFHEISSASYDPTTGAVTFYDHINWQGMKGVGTDGNQYSAADVTRDEQQTVPIVPGLSMHVSTTMQEENELISLGSDPNQIIHVTTTTSVDVDPLGNPLAPPTVTISGPGLKCTG